MGRASRAKRERREATSFTASLTATEGTWLESPPSKEEQERITAARRALQQHRAEAEALGADPEEAARFSLEVFRDPRFAPLYFDDWVVESVLEQFGEPPVVEEEGDTSFTDYLRAASTQLASARVRRSLVDQVQRFVPQYVEAGQFREALAIEYNIYLTSYVEGTSPLLVQMLVGALTRWYEEHEEDDAAAPAE